MSDIVSRLREPVGSRLSGRDPQPQYDPVFDQVRIEAADEIERLRALVEDVCEAFDHYDLPKHAFRYRRVLDHQQSTPGAI